MQEFNPLKSYLGGQLAGQQQQEIEKQRAMQQQITQLTGSLAQSSTPQLEPEFQQLVQADPARAKQMVEIATGGDVLRANAMLKDAKTAKYLLSNGNVDGATQLLKNRIQALGDRSGEHTQVVYQDIVNGKPDEALSKINSFLSIFDPEAIKKQGKSETATAEQKNFEKLQELKTKGTPQEVQAFEKLIGLTEDQKMSAGLEKQILKSQDDFFTFSEQARKMDTLANDINRINIGGGLQSTVSETLKNILGSTDDVSNLRREFNAIRTSQATTNLPPGPASDKDIQLALSGFPKENANAPTIISFLKGQSKLAKINEKFAEFKADYYAKNKSPSGLITAWKKSAENMDFGQGKQVDEASIMAKYGLN